MAVYGNFKKISSDAILDNAITAAKIQNNAINTAKIGNNAVSSAKILDGVVSTEKLASTLDLSSKTVSYRSILNSDIDASAGIATSKISGLGTLATLNSVNSATIADGSIDNVNKFATGARFHSAVFMGQVSGNPGASQTYVQWTTNTNSDTSIFETNTTGNLGLKIKKAGQIIWYWTNEVNGGSNTSSYVYVSQFINGSVIGRQLISQSSEWDCISICGAYSCNANDNLEHKFESRVTSAGGWSQLMVRWVGFI
jgi:hypothetical protein